MKRTISLNKNSGKRSNVLYLMELEKRVEDNSAFKLGWDISHENEGQFYVGSYLVQGMNVRQELFFYEGLNELENELRNLNVCFLFMENIETFIKANDVSDVILEYSSLREMVKHNKMIVDICKKADVSVYECDARNIVPARILNIYKKTGKAVKNMLYKHFDTFFREFKTTEIVYKQHLYNKTDLNFSGAKKFKMKKPNVENFYKTKLKGGIKEAKKVLNHFLNVNLKNYAKLRNNPDFDVQSNLSPYLHAGFISSARVVTELFRHNGNSFAGENVESFVNEIFVWRETSQHFCLHNPNYDNINGALDWARESLLIHKKDKREKIYSLEQLERAETSDIAWNASQKQMLITGKMHGYTRMYWAKQLLKWTKTPEEAIKIGVYLNDKYSLDGNSEGGFLGVMWSICGSMDQGYKEREITGKIRPMNAYKAPNFIKEWSSKEIEFS